MTSKFLTLKILSLLYFILLFCNLQNIYHKNAQSHKSTKILTLKIFRPYGHY